VSAMIGGPNAAPAAEKRRVVAWSFFSEPA
jgi:hypothetical protein